MKTLKESLLSNAGLDKNSYIKKHIEDWLKEMGIRNYIINPDMTIDVNGGVWLYDKDLKELPGYIQFNKVFGDFNCSENQLISLKGCPKEVSGEFNCSINELDSLEYGPQITGWYTCSHNNLKSLKYCGEVKNILQCQYNQLKDLEYCPQKCTSVFCHGNELVSLRGAPGKIKGSFICRENKLKKLEFCPHVVGNSFDCSFNKLESLKGCPNKTKRFACNNNNVKFTINDVLQYCDVGINNIYTIDM